MAAAPTPSTAAPAPSTALQLERLTPHLGAVVADVDLTRIDAASFADIDAALVEHKLLLFRGQQWDATQQRDFARRFGELHVHPVFDADAEQKDLVVFAYDARRRGDNDTWHSDVTFVEAPVKVGVLYAVQIPPLGGDTLWLDTEAAYAALSPPLRDLVDGLQARHAFFQGHESVYHGRDGVRDVSHARAVLPPVVHPVVRTHPVSGRKSLFVNRAFTTGIEGLSKVESAHLLRLLLEHLEHPQFQVRWRWQAGDVAIWDNRSTQHLAVSDYFPEPRHVRRAAVLGDRPF